MVAPLEAPSADILRFATAGSVDDGKSSLIGRLLYDSKSILEDQLRSIEHASRQRGADQIELALLTDGLRAEREQNITIDVAYRYFATARRKFIVADTPGHLQYTRNMVTGTSTADLSVILIDARKGVLTQSRRHAAISALLGIRHLVVAVNKMDLVDFREEIFAEIVAEFRAFTERLGVRDVAFIPMSALLGDNVVDRSLNTPWYGGPPLLEYLEEVRIDDLEETTFRFPVQYVVRPHQDFRGLAGQVESGSIAVGDAVVVASTGIQSRVDSLYVAGEKRRQAHRGEPVVVSLENDVDVSRGDMLTSPFGPPVRSDRFEAVVCWLQDTPLQLGQRYTLLHTTRRVPAVVEAVLSRVDVDSLDPIPASELGMNDLGRLAIHTASPLSFDLYRDNRVTGSFLLVDFATNVTLAAGMIESVRAPEFGGHARKAGKVIWLDTWSSRGEEIAAELEAFGRPVLLLQLGALDLVAKPISALARLASVASSQGFDVLIATPLTADEQASHPPLPATLEPGSVVGTVLSELDIE